MAVDAARGHDKALAGDDLGARSDIECHAVLDVRVAGAADGGYVAVLDADVGLVDPGIVDNQRVGDDGVDCLGAGKLRLALSVADDLAAAELHLAAGGQILLNFNDEIGISEAHAIACGRSEHVRISFLVNLAHLKFRYSDWKLQAACRTLLLSGRSVRKTPA